MTLAPSLAALECRLARPLPGEAAHRRLSISERPSGLVERGTGWSGA